MVRLAANLTMLFSEYPFLERFDRAAAAGFESVEFFFPYGLDAAGIRDALDRNGLELALFNLPLGDWDAGERGFVAQAGREAEFAAGLAEAVDYARVLRPVRVNSPSGPAPDTKEAFGIAASNFALAADALEAIGVGLVIEPINRHDVPGALVSTVDRAVELLDRVGSDNFGVQYDLYHSVRADEDPFAVVAAHAGRITHVQVADVPGRHQPGTGALDFPRFFEALDTAGYTGRVSLEYHPDGPTEQSFGLVTAAGLLAPRV
jgi:hydroxypyruvate isomerase